MNGFQSQLEALYHPDEKNALKQRAWARFKEMGLPEKKHEAFRYFPLHAFYQQTLKLEGSFSKKDFPKEIVVMPLEKALVTYGILLQNRFNRDEHSPFALINGALYQEGLFLYVPPQTKLDEPLIIYHLVRGSCAFPRLYLFLGKGAKLSLIYETSFDNDEAWNNAFIDASIDEGAQLALHFKGNCPASAWHFETLRASLKRDSRLEIVSFLQGSQATRQDIEVCLEGENSETSIKGGWFLEKERQAHAYISVKHKAPYTRSNQHFKGVLKDRARSSFEGKIFVDANAQKTEAYQLNNNLVLGERAICYSKPNLQIFADDVKASHGSTTSNLDPEALFFFKSRGILEETARDYLIRGFLKDIYV